MESRNNMYRLLRKLLFRYTRKTFNEQKEEVLEQLQERERELRNDWLSSSVNFLEIPNNKKIINHWAIFLTRHAKNIALFICTLGLAQFLSLLANSKWRSPSSIRELKSLESRRREIQRAKAYFKRIQDNERDYEENKAKELEPWSEEIVSYSLASMPFSKHEEITDKRRNDPYLRFLHIYAIVISCFFTGGLILFYFLYKKSRDPRYRFLDSALSKHVIEGKKFEKYLTELIRQKYEFDSISNLQHCLNSTFKDTALASTIQTKCFRAPFLKTALFFILSLLTGGLLPMYVYWISAQDNIERFNKWWSMSRVRESGGIEPLGNISRTWWGRIMKFFRRAWTDLHISGHVSSTINLAITSSFLKPTKSPKQLNWGLFWMFTSPLAKWMINLFLLLLSYTFLLIWSLQYKFGLTEWPFYTMVASSSLFLLLLGYHIYLVI